MGLFWTTANRLFPEDPDLEADRKLTRAEARRLYNQWRVMKGGKAGIPATWMWKDLEDMTLAEAIAYHEAIKSGQSWGDIQKKGLAGDEGELTAEEYRAAFGGEDDPKSIWYQGER